MKNTLIKSVSLVLLTAVSALLFTGCANNFGGAGIGAGIGAGAGALIDKKHPLQGALIGGLIGGGVGYIANDQINKHKAEAAEKAAKENRTVKYEVKEIKDGKETTNTVVATPTGTTSATGKRIVKTQVLDSNGKVLEEKTMEVAGT